MDIVLWMLWILYWISRHIIYHLRITCWFLDSFWSAMVEWYWFGLVLLPPQTTWTAHLRRPFDVPAVLQASPQGPFQGGQVVIWSNSHTMTSIKHFSSACWTCLCVWHTRLEWFPGWVSHCFLLSVSLHHIIQWSYQIFQNCIFNRTRSTN